MGLNFDELNIAKDYVKGRQLVPEAKEIWEQVILRHIQPGKITIVLDLGCGIGRFLPFLAEIFPSAQIMGVEPSIDMLVEAKAVYDEKFEIILGSGENIPLTDSSVDVVFMSMVYHTFEDKTKAITEIFRVLKPGGFLVMKQFTLETNKNSIYMKFFPGSFKFADVQGDNREEMTKGFLDNGFKIMFFENVSFPIAKNYQELLERESKRGRSVYKIATDEVFYKDVENFKKFCQVHGQEGPVMDQRDLFIFQKPPL